MKYFRFKSHAYRATKMGIYGFEGGWLQGNFTPDWLLYAAALLPYAIFAQQFRLVGDAFLLLYKMLLAPLFAADDAYALFVIPFQHYSLVLFSRDSLPGWLS